MRKLISFTALAAFVAGMLFTTSCKKNDDPSLKVEPGTLEFAGAGESKPVTVSTDQNDYEIEITVDWLSHASKSPAGFLLIATQNGDSPRSTTVRVSAGGINRTINVSQEAYTPEDHITVKPSTFEVPFPGVAEETFMVDTNLESWKAEVTSGGDFVTITEKLSKSFTIKVEYNSGDSRTAVITVTSEGSDATGKLTINQEEANYVSRTSGTWTISGTEVDHVTGEEKGPVSWESEAITSWDLDFSTYYWAFPWKEQGYYAFLEYYVENSKTYMVYWGGDQARFDYVRDPQGYYHLMGIGIYVKDYPPKDYPFPWLVVGINGALGEKNDIEYIPAEVANPTDFSFSVKLAEDENGEPINTKVVYGSWKLGVDANNKIISLEPIGTIVADMLLTPSDDIPLSVTRSASVNRQLDRTVYNVAVPTQINILRKASVNKMSK